MRLILYVFLVTFAAARVTVFLIMDHGLPDLFLHVGGTHVHHLNYGIFLLSGVGGYVLVARPSGRIHLLREMLYAMGLVLTFDEFGMWLHLGGPYWQRASFDAVVLIAAVIALLAFAPDVRRGSRQRWVEAGLLVLVLSVFGVTLLSESHCFRIIASRH
ncbi:MAG: hypothetical protein DWH84_01030 [Planctomycetota bacterium]|nr:MAG: hypothetical protein DWH84_01030 [Planctomycetota bacterium]